MQNKKLYIIFGFVVILVGAAAFIAGRFLNGDIDFAGWGDEPYPGRVSISINDVTPAPELPTLQADVTGRFIERNDNTILVQSIPLDLGVGGVADENVDRSYDVKVEIVVTGETKIYKDVTEIPEPVNGQIKNLQQSVDEGTLEDINTDTFVTAWGRHSGERIIADVLFYTNPKMIKKP